MFSDLYSVKSGLGLVLFLFIYLFILIFPMRPMRLLRYLSSIDVFFKHTYAALQCGSMSNIGSDFSIFVLHVCKW